MRKLGLSNGFPYVTSLPYVMSICEYIRVFGKLAEMKVCVHVRVMSGQKNGSQLPLAAKEAESACFFGP